MTLERHSLRVRLTLWLAALLTLAALPLAGASWLLLTRSVTRAKDEALRAQVEGVRRFLADLEPDLPGEERQDELRELALGASSLELRDANGGLLCRSPGVAWDEIAAALPLPADGTFATAEVELAGRALRLARERIQAGGRSYDVLVALPTSQTVAALARFRNVLTWLLPALIATAAAAGYWMTGRALDPVDRMTRSVRAIDARRLAERIDVPKDAELRQLASTFNDMLARLEASFAEAERFTADAAHELRTPVTLVRTTAEIALRRERSAAEYRDALLRVRQEAERMSGLVEDLLALARADAGVEPRSSAVCDLGHVARAAAQELWAADPSRRPALRIERSPAVVEVRGDAPSLRRLVHAVLDNAQKYTPADGQVLVRVAREGEQAVLEVHDTGIGITAEELPHLFERFHRGMRGRELRTEGTGLGLAIAREIVERHRGTIAIESPEGKGCKVSVRLPAAVMPLADHATDVAAGA